MLAAENGGLPRGKVGGLGDVVRDLPKALAARGHRVTVMTPAYGMFARLPGAKRVGSVSVPFAGAVESVSCLALPGPVDGVEYQILDHPRFSPDGSESIYHDDGHGAPFATDANKFAFFSAAAAAWVGRLKPVPDVLHLHDWHLGFFFLLRAFNPRLKALKSIRSVFTIHNMAVQGIRPIKTTESSLEHWFPQLKYPVEIVADPRYADCLNPLAVAIRLADMVNTVSPAYVDEIIVPNDEITGFRGGEQLEDVLELRHRNGELVGILNGCDYPETQKRKPSWKQLVEILRQEVLSWIAGSDSVDAGAYVAEKRIAELPKKRPGIIATSVGRVNEQKLGIFRQPAAKSALAIDRVLAALDDGLLIMLGSGDPEYERFFVDRSVQHPNLLFLKGYSDPLSAALYSAGDLFLMPSVFEPCGISQMLAMRAGQPCVAHAVGGLRDTVKSSNGFPFDGQNPRQQAEHFVREVAAAIDLKQSRPNRWKAIVSAASSERFSWDKSAKAYLSEVYAFASA